MLKIQKKLSYGYMISSEYVCRIVFSSLAFCLYFIPNTLPLISDSVCYVILLMLIVYFQRKTALLNYRLHWYSSTKYIELLYTMMYVPVMMLTYALLSKILVDIVHLSLLQLLCLSATVQLAHFVYKVFKLNPELTLLKNLIEP